MAYFDDSKENVELKKPESMLDKMVNLCIESQENKEDHVHSWKTYTGLVETFTYCTKCDERKV